MQLLPEHGTRAPYDEHAQWYDNYINSKALAFTRAVSDLLVGLLGDGRGRRCLDIGCGTGIQAAPVASHGWIAHGVDLSFEQLAIARFRLPVVQGDVAALPFATASIDAVVSCLTHTDVDDFIALTREVSRVLLRGGDFIYVGVHPCFVGPFAERDGDQPIIIHKGYEHEARVFHGPGM